MSNKLTLYLFYCWLQGSTGPCGFEKNVVILTNPFSPFHYRNPDFFAPEHRTELSAEILGLTWTYFDFLYLLQLFKRKYFKKVIWYIVSQIMSWYNKLFLFSLAATIHYLKSRQAEHIFRIAYSLSTEYAKIFEFRWSCTKSQLWIILV